MNDQWPLALGLLLGGILVGGFVGWLVRRRMIKARGGDATSSVAGVAGLFTFWFIVVVAATAALAVFNPETLDDLPRQVLEYLPRLLAAGLILIAGYAIAVGATRFVAYGMERATGSTRIRVGTSIRWIIIGAAGILALAQLGVDTSILLIIVAVIGVGVALSFALIIGLGGRDIAREVAAGRYVKRLVRVGALISAGPVSGKVAALRPATMELVGDDGRTSHVPYTALMESGFTLDDPGEG